MASSENYPSSSPFTEDTAKRHASVTFSDSSTIINDEDAITPPAGVFPDDKPGNRIILPDPFLDDDEDGVDVDDPISPFNPTKKPHRSQSRISDFRDHGVKAPSMRTASKKRSSSGSLKPLKFSSADGRAYGTVSGSRGRRRSMHSLSGRSMSASRGTMCSVCRLQRKSLEPAAPASRAGFVGFVVGMNVVFLAATVFCVVWPAMRREWSRVGCAVVPATLWLAFIVVTASSWRLPSDCECPPLREASRSTGGRKRRQSSGPLFPKPGLWLDRSQQKPGCESDSEATEV